MSWTNSFFASRRLFLWGTLFSAIGLLTYLGIQIINGRRAADNIPVEEIFDGAVSVHSVGGGPCTATVVGPSTLLTAAHCPGANSGTSKLTLNVHIRDQHLTATCTRASAFAKLPTGVHRDDLAVCTTEGPIMGIPYEVVGRSESITQGQDIVLVGFGCDSKNVNRLRMGDAIVALPKSADNQIVTEVAGAQSCRGDSGGAVYLHRTDTKGRPVRRLIGVISGRAFLDEGTVTRIARVAGSSLSAQQLAGVCGADGIHEPGIKGCRW